MYCYSIKRIHMFVVLVLYITVYTMAGSSSRKLGCTIILAIFGHDH